MDIFEDAIVPETPKALPNEQLFIYVPIGTIDNPGIVTFDDADFRIDEHGRVYMKASSTENAKDIRDIFALLYGYREGEPAEGEEPGPVLASIKAMENKINGTQEELAREVQLSTLTIAKSQWEDSDPKMAYGNVSGLFAFTENTRDRKVSILLLPVDNATRVESRSIGIEVTKVSLMTDIRDVTICFSRSGEAPTMDLKYVVIAFTEPNETWEAFAVSAGFIGIGGFGAGDGGEEENSDLPEYWKNHVSEKAEEINTIQDGAGQDWFSYAVIADTHFAQQRGSYTGSLAKQISDKCGINFVLCLGDMVSRGTIESKDASEAEFNGFWELMKPVIDRLLVTQGNHDGYYYNGNANYYPLNEALARVYNGMRVKYPLCWSENGAGYAVDDNASKTRFIMLNTSARPMGSTLTNYMNTFGYTQAQYEMLYWSLLTIPNDRWRVVVASHVAPVWVVDRFGDGVVVTDIRDQFSDAKQMIEMLNAYVSRGKASISHGTDSNDFRYVRMDVDFTGAKGSLIAYHAGHYHVDKVFRVGNIVNDDQTLLFPVILHRCDSFNENQGSQSSVEAQLEAERVQGTATEHSFDIVTVDLKEGVIHCTKIGAGNDRVISIGGTGDDEGDETAVYTVTTNFTNCGWDFEGDTIEHGSPLYAMFSPIAGYGDPSVTVTMGGVDITDDVWADNEINILSVTGDIVITATATKPAYGITFNLTNVTANKGAPSVSHGGSYSTFLTPSDGYTLDYSSVTVTMGETDITGTAFDTHTRFVTIDSVTGDIVITATATKVITVTNYADPASSDWLLDYRLGSGAASEYPGTDNMVTNYIPCKKGDVIRVKNFNIGYFKNESGALRCHYLNADKSIIGNTQPYSNGAFLQIENDGRYGIFSWEYIVGTTGDQSTYLDYADDIAYMRFCGYLADGKTTSDVIITVNQEIQ